MPTLCPLAFSVTPKDDHYLPWVLTISELSFNGMVQNLLYFA